MTRLTQLRQEVWPLIRRDWLDLKRQRRLWFYLILQPLLFAPLILFFPLYVGERETSQLLVERPVIYVEGSAPRFLSALEKQGIDVRRTDDADKAVLQEKGAGLIASPSLEKAYRQRAPASVRILINAARPSSVFRSFALRSALTSMWGGVAPKVDDPFGDAGQLSITLDDVGRSSLAGRRFLAATVPLYLWFPFTMMMMFSTSVLSSEKDARTFESLLAMPLTRLRLVAAKFTVAFSGAAMLLVATILPVVALNWLPVDIGQSQLLSGFGSALLVLTLAGIGTTFAAVSIGLLIGAYTRSMREASSLIGLVSLPLAGVGVTFLLGADVSSAASLGPLPVLGIIATAKQALETGGSLKGLAFAVIWNLAVSFVLVLMAVFFVRREQSILRSQA